MTCWRAISRRGSRCPRRQPTAAAHRRSTRSARGPRWCATSKRCSRSTGRAPSPSTTATTSGPRRLTAASWTRGRFRGSCRRTCARCSARGGARSDGWPYPASRPTFAGRTSSSSSCFPTTRISSAGSGWPARACRFRDSRRGYGERERFGLAINDLVARGELRAPIVIGRDHLDTGSVASPYRETEAMADGSDAIADWPILNALLNAVGGATWVSVHHGGGVGIGYSLHAGMVIVADGSADAARRLRRVLATDPGIGIVRHADAGYPQAAAAARRHGLVLPMRSAEG